MNIARYKNIKYIFNQPTTFSDNEKYPVIIFLHGAGSRGDDINLLISNPFFKYDCAHIDEAMIYVPQCNAFTWFEIYEQLNDFIEHIMSLKTSDRNRIYLVGTSMGGYAVWQLAISHPEYFAGIVPICGAGMYCMAERLKNTNVWAFHGKNDDVVLCEESIKMIERINAAGGFAKITIYDNTGHDSWTSVYKDKEVFKWLLDCRLKKTLSNEDKLINPEIYG